MKIINIKNLIKYAKKNNKFKEFMFHYMYSEGFFIILHILREAILTKDIDIILNMNIYFPIYFSNIYSHKNDFTTMKLLLKYLIADNYTFRFILYNISTFKLEIIQSIIYSIEQTASKIDFLIIVTKNHFKVENNNYEHVVVYNNIDKTLYDVMKPKEMIFIQNTNCVVNSTCYILNKAGIKYTHQGLVTLFGICQLNEMIVETIQQVLDK